MAGKNQVTLTFAGDSTKLEQAFDRVGASAKKMGGEVESTGSSFDRVGGSVDDLGQKGGDLESGFRGITDSMSGFSQLAKGDVLGGLTDLAGGVEALSFGFKGVLIPAMGKGVAAMRGVRLASFAMLGPWLLVGAAVAALAFLVIRNWDKIKAATAAVGRFIGNVFRGVIDFFKAVPGALRRAGSTLFNILTFPYRTAFNAIATMWNRTVGRISFKAPDWVPGIGGKGFDVPDIPTFHRGGVVPGAPGSEMVGLLQAGERISPAGASNRTVIEIRSGGARLDDLLVEVLRNAVRSRGGLDVVFG